MRLYDSIVVGGGPAGATAAREMARAGLKVLLLEKEQMPRYKCCAGGVPRKVTGLIDFDCSSLFEKKIRGTVFSWRSRARRYLEGPGTLGWVVRRESFDHFLLRQADRDGAEVRQGETFLDLFPEGEVIRVRTDRKEYRCLTLIGADGASSRVADRLRLSGSRHFGFALEARIYTGEEELRKRDSNLYFDFGSVPRGYAWIFPRRDHLSVGVATRYRFFPRARSFLRGYMEREGLRAGDGKWTVRGGRLAFNPTVRRLARGRCLLAGDAAGLTDRLSGEGIFGAVKSGNLAAKAVSGLLSGDLEPGDYRRMIRKSLGTELFLAGVLSRIEETFPRWIYRRVFSNDANARKAAEVVQGELSYRDLLKDKLSRKLKLKRK